MVVPRTPIVIGSNKGIPERWHLCAAAGVITPWTRLSQKIVSKKAVWWEDGEDEVTKSTEVCRALRAEAECRVDNHFHFKGLRTPECVLPRANLTSHEAGPANLWRKNSACPQDENQCGREAFAG